MKKRRPRVTLAPHFTFDSHPTPFPHLQVVEIERLEKDVVEMRSEVRARESATAVTKAARQQQNTTLEMTAAQMEAQLVEASAAAARMQEEVKAMFPVIDFAFYTLGCDQAFEVPTGTPGSPVKPKTPAPSSPLRSKTASLKMYTANPAMKEDVRSGVTAGSIAQFMGIVENRSADIIQQFAAVNIGGSGNAAAMLAAGGTFGGGSRSTSPAPDATASAALGSTADPRRAALSPAALGPSRPTGRLKESLTSSALVAALAVDASKMDAPDGDKDDERPISLEELKRQAMRQMEGDKNFRAVRSAAFTAASVLTRGGTL